MMKRRNDSDDPNYIPATFNNHDLGEGYHKTKMLDRDKIKHEYLEKKKEDLAKELFAHSLVQAEEKRKRERQEEKKREKRQRRRKN